MNHTIRNSAEEDQLIFMKQLIAQVDPCKDIVLAGSDQEFFYLDTDEPVQEGDPVGIEVDISYDRSCDSKSFLSSLCLFKNIYWSDKYLL